MPVLLGSSYLRWTIGASTYTFYLRVPLQKREASHRKRRYIRESVDYSKRVVTTIGTGVYELSGDVRYSDDPTGFLAMLIAGADGVPLTYFDGAASMTCVLIEPSGELVEILRDSEANPDYEFTQKIRLRATDTMNTANRVR